MLLAIDIGNTHTVIGVYAGDSLRAMWRIATNRKAAADELRIVFSTLFSLEGLDLSQVRASAVASVVPQLTKAWMQAIKDATGALSLVCNAETAAGLFDADYPNPREIGADRVADAVAARALYGAPVVVVDFGTATNIEVVDRDGRFRGGVIAPGVQTSANALFTHGAQLPDIALVAPPAVIGTNTVEAIQSGIMLGEADRVDGLVRRIFDQLGYSAKVIATGGLAPVVERYSSTIDEVNTELTLEGDNEIGPFCSMPSLNLSGDELLTVGEPDSSGDYYFAAFDLDGNELARSSQPVGSFDAVMMKRPNGYLLDTGYMWELYAPDGTFLEKSLPVGERETLCQLCGEFCTFDVFLPLEENAFLAVGHHGKATEPDEPVVFRITTDF